MVVFCTAFVFFLAVLLQLLVNEGLHETAVIAAAVVFAIWLGQLGGDDSNTDGDDDDGVR